MVTGGSVRPNLALVPNTVYILNHCPFARGGHQLSKYRLIKEKGGNRVTFKLCAKFLSKTCIHKQKPFRYEYTSAKKPTCKSCQELFVTKIQNGFRQTRDTVRACICNSLGQDPCVAGPCGSVAVLEDAMSTRIHDALRARRAEWCKWFGVVLHALEEGEECDGWCGLRRCACHC